MKSRPVEQAPSETALFTALRRALACRETHDDRLGPDSLAEIFLPGMFRFFLRFPMARQKAKRQLAAAMPGMNEYLIARTAYFDELFRGALESGAAQIVLLGAGYDSRACRFASQNRGTIIYELDAPPTQNQKIRCLQAAHIPIPAGVRFVPVNFLRQSLPDVLAAAGFRAQEPSLFLWEGVSYYLDRAAVAETLSFAGRGSHPQSAIAWDYAIPLAEESAGQVYGAREFAAAMQDYHKEEGLRFALPDGELEGFLAGCGLRLVECLDPAAMEQSYLRDAHGAPVGQVAGMFRLVRAAPLGGSGSKF